VVRPVKAGFRTLFGITSGACWKFWTFTPASWSRCTPPPSPLSAQLDAGRPQFDLQRQRAGGRLGRLTRFDLTAKTPTLLDTTRPIGTTTTMSLFDGTMLGLSDQSPDHGGQSCIFTVPVQGGTARRITPLTPSYLHGWSAGRQVARLHRQSHQQIRHLPNPADGSGAEVRLTDSPALMTARNTRRTGIQFISIPAAPAKCKSGG